MTHDQYTEQDDTIDTAVCDHLLMAQTPLAPPAELRAKVLARVHAQSAPTTLPLDWGWKTLAPGIEVKLLLRDTQAGSKSFLLRAAPGMSLPAHEHHEMEECLVLEGEFSVNGVTLRAGDYQCAPKGSRHGISSTRTGVLVYLRAGLADYPGV